MPKCLNCGYDPEAGRNYKQTAGMNTYKNKATGIKAVFNRDEVEFKVTPEGGTEQTWIRADKANADETKPKVQVETPTPIVPPKA